MTTLQGLILGITQGLTEFLPISSSGHLILIPTLFRWNIQSLTFDTVLHLGTLSALVIYFYKDIFTILKSRKLLLLMFVGSVPAAIIGYFLESTIENIFRSAHSVAVFLAVGTGLMILAELVYKKSNVAQKIENIESITLKKSVIIGFFQSLALFSGVSRSGSTISGGMLFGLKRDLAARFSFLLSMPIVAGAAAFKILESYKSLTLDGAMLGGFLGSFIVGILAINFLIKYLKNKNLWIFIIYRTLLVLALFLLF